MHVIVFFFFFTFDFFLCRLLNALSFFVICLNNSAFLFSTGAFSIFDNLLGFLFCLLQPLSCFLRCFFGFSAAFFRRFDFIRYIFFSFLHHVNKRSPSVFLKQE